MKIIDSILEKAYTRYLSFNLDSLRSMLLKNKEHLSSEEVTFFREFIRRDELKTRILTIFNTLLSIVFFCIGIFCVLYPHTFESEISSSDNPLYAYFFTCFCFLYLLLLLLLLLNRPNFEKQQKIQSRLLEILLKQLFSRGKYSSPYQDENIQSEKSIQEKDADWHEELCHFSFQDIALSVCESRDPRYSSSKVKRINIKYILTIPSQNFDELNFRPEDTFFIKENNNARVHNGVRMNFYWNIYFVMAICAILVLSVFYFNYWNVSLFSINDFIFIIMCVVVSMSFIITMRKDEALWKQEYPKRKIFFDSNPEIISEIKKLKEILNEEFLVNFS